MSMLDALILKRISVNSGTEITPRRGMLNLIQGSGITITGGDDPTGEGRTNVTISASGGGGTGLDYLLSVRGTSTAALPAYTRVSNVLTANANGAFPTIDGLTYSTTQRFLLRHGASAVDNGIYTLTNAGGAGAPWVLTRATDLDETSELSPGQIVAVEEGTTYTASQWLVKGPGPLTINVSALNWAKISPPLGTVTGTVQTWNNTTLEWQIGDFIILNGAGSYVAIGTGTAASVGALRHINTGSAYARGSGAFDIRIYQVLADDRVYFGDETNALDVVYRVKSTGSHILQVGGNNELVVNSTTIDAQNNNVVTTGFFAAGSGTVAASGLFRVPNNIVAVAARRTDATDANLIYLSNTNTLIVGDQFLPVAAYFSNVAAGGTFTWRVDNANEMVLSATALDLQNNNLVTTGFVSVGATPATAGSLRLNSTGSIQARNVGNSANYPLVTASADGLIIGDGTAAFVTYRCTGSGGHLLEVGGSEQLRVVTSTFEWKSTVTAPIFRQASKTSGTGETFLIKAQSVTAGSGAGGIVEVRGGDTSNNSVGGNVDIYGGNATNTGTHTGGSVTINGGSANGASGTRTGGSVIILPGTGATAGGEVEIRNAAGSPRFVVDDTGVAFYNTNGFARPAAYTDNYITFTRTLAALTTTTLTDSTTGTANTTVVDVGGSFNQATLNNNFADIIAQVNNLIADGINLRGVVNQLRKDLKDYGLLQ